MIQLYEAKIRLGGSVSNEVRKSDLTAAEILLLREIHGQDAVLDIRATGTTKRTSTEERARLMAAYASPAESNADSTKRKVQLLRDLFGHDSMGLPTKLDDIAPALAAAEKPKRVTIEEGALA